MLYSDTFPITTFFIISINTLRPIRNEHFADDIFKRIFFNENVWISIKISPKFVPNGPINNKPALVQMMVWRRSGDKPLSEPMMVSLPTHICVTRPQWVNVILYTPSFFCATRSNPRGSDSLWCFAVERPGSQIHNKYSVISLLWAAYMRFRHANG